MRLPLISNIIGRTQDVSYRLSPDDQETFKTVVENCLRQIEQLRVILRKLTITKTDSTFRKGYKAVVGIAEESRTAKIATALKDNVHLLTCLNTLPVEKEKTPIERRTSGAPPRYSDSTGIFSVPFVRDFQFVTRGETLPSITKAFENQNRVAIAGIGGVG